MAWQEVGGGKRVDLSNMGGIIVFGFICGFDRKTLVMHSGMAACAFDILSVSLSSSSKKDNPMDN